MARKKKTYRQLMREFYDFAVSSAKRALEKWGIDVKIPSPSYKESRSRNYQAYTRKVSRKLDELDERIAIHRQLEEEQRYKEFQEDQQRHKEEQSDWEDDDEIESEEDDYDYHHEFDEHQQTQLDVEAYERAEEGHIYMSWELALYHNYMTRLYYYQFIPAVRALIDTIEGDDEIQELIILALSGKNDKLPLPELKKVGYYEEGMDVASKIQAFLNSTTKEQLLDEAYPQVL